LRKIKYNCKDYENCVGCKYLKTINVKNKDLKGNIEDKKVSICEYNGTINDIFKEN